MIVPLKSPAARCRAGLRHYRWPLFVVNLASGLAAILYVSMVPMKYEASAALAVTAEPIRPDASSAISPENRPAAIVARLLGQAHMCEMAKAAEADSGQNLCLEGLYSVERNNDAKGEIIRLRYRHVNPRHAAAMVDSAINLLERWRLEQQVEKAGELVRLCQSEAALATIALRQAATALIACQEASGLFAPEQQIAVTEEMGRRIDSLDQSLRMEESSAALGTAHSERQLRRARICATANVRAELRRNGGGVLLRDEEHPARIPDYDKLRHQYHLATTRRDTWEETNIRSQAYVGLCPPLHVVERTLVPDKRVEPRRRLLAISWAGIVASASLSLACAMGLVSPHVRYR